MQEGNIGSKHSEEHKTKISTSHIGKKRDTKTVEAIRESSSKTYEFINPSGNVIMIKNLTKFCADNDLDRTTMTKVFKGIYKTHKGYRKVT